LEARRVKTELSREAWIVTDPSDTAAEHHLVLVSPANARRCQFEQRPGPGPQLADFGEFDMFIELSSDVSIILPYSILRHGRTTVTAIVETRVSIRFK
jgi:hypothetical protein